MLQAVVTRKNRTLKTIQAVRSLPPTQQSNDNMCFCYVLAFGALEYMVESVIRGWVQHNIRKHKIPYPGKPKVDFIITVLNDLAEFNLGRNNGIKYEVICTLIERTTGQTNKTLFKSKVSAYSGGKAGLNAAIMRIENIRHSVAHGALLPDQTSPNLYELEKDFLHIYNCLIVNLDAVLPRK